MSITRSVTWYHFCYCYFWILQRLGCWKMFRPTFKDVLEAEKLGKQKWLLETPCIYPKLPIWQYPDALKYIHPKIAAINKPPVQNCISKDTTILKLLAQIITYNKTKKKPYPKISLQHHPKTQFPRPFYCENIYPQNPTNNNKHIHKQHTHKFDWIAVWLVCS